MSKFVKVQKTQIRRIKPAEKAGNEGSPYWNYLAKKAGTDENSNDSGAMVLKEPQQANPDVLAESCAMYYVTEETREKQELVRQALKRTRLSKREKQIIDLTMYHDKTQVEIADLLDISQPVVSIYYKRALEKIKKFIEKENK